MLRLYFLPLLLLQPTNGFVLPLARRAAPSLPGRSLAADDSHQDLDLQPLLVDDETSLYVHCRRPVLRQGIMTAAALLLVNAATPLTATAGIDPAALKSLRVEGDDTGGATRLRQIQAASMAVDSADSVDKPWEELSSGVSFREYRQGRGDAGTYIYTECYRGVTMPVFVCMFVW